MRTWENTVARRENPGYYELSRRFPTAFISCKSADQVNDVFSELDKSMLAEPRQCRGRGDGAARPSTNRGNQYGRITCGGPQTASAKT